MVGFRDQTRSAQLIDDAAKKARTHGQVKHHVVVDTVAELDRLQALAQLHIRSGGAKVGRQVGDAGQQALEVGLVQRLGIVLVGGEGAYRRFYVAAKGLVTHFQPVHANQGEVGGQ